MYQSWLTSFLESLPLGFAKVSSINKKGQNLFRYFLSNFQEILCFVNKIHSNLSVSYTTDTSWYWLYEKNMKKPMIFIQLAVFSIQQFSIQQEKLDEKFSMQLFAKHSLPTFSNFRFGSTIFQGQLTFKVDYL